MPLPSSSFAKAKLQLAEFAEARKIGPALGEGVDVSFIQYRVPRHIMADDASDQLLYAAVCMTTKYCQYTVSDDEIALFIPASFDPLPVKRIEQSLHDLRRMLLQNMQQQSDGSFKITKTFSPNGMTNVELGELVKTLATPPSAVASPSVKVETLYRPPHNPRQSVQPPKSMKREAFIAYQHRHFEATGLDVPPGAAEAYVSINGEAAESIFKNLGIDMGGRVH